MASALSEEQLAGYRETFALFDENGDGHISVQELVHVLRSFGQNPTESEIKKMLDSIDVNRDGTIEFDEFIGLMGRHNSENTEDDELLEAFKVFDTDGSGAISISELSEVMKHLGETLSQAELQKMIEEADLDGDHEISFEEFRRIMAT